MKALLIGLTALVASFLFVTGFANAQTASPTTTPSTTVSPTTTVTPSPTTSTGGTNTTLPSGAPQTGFGF